MTFRFVFAVILLLVALVAIGVGNRQVKDSYGKEHSAPARTAGFVVLGFAVLFFLLSCIRVVSAGEVGIPVTLGNAGTPMGAGIHLVNPLADVQALSVRTENYTMSASNGEGNKNGDDSVSVLGSDGAPASVDSTVLFHLDQGSASRVYKDLGTSYVDKLVRPSIRTCIRDAFTQSPIVVAATSGRDQVATSIQTCIEGKLQGEGIVLEQFQLRDVHLGQQVQDSINAKVSAQQTAEQQQFELLKSQQQAEIARVTAQGQADSQQIISCGGHAEATPDGSTHVVPNTGAACQQTLSQPYLEYLYIQALNATANSPNHSTFVIPGATNLTPLLNVPNG